jgi:DNA-binding protein HU-beta
VYFKLKIRKKLYHKLEKIMNKDQLVSKVANEHGITKSQAYDIVESIFNNISEVLLKEEKVNIIGFGKFYIQTRKSRKGRNPQTGASIMLPECRIPIFKVGKKLKEKFK